jgi:DNA-binding CsgD family transcriptional regulator
VSDQMNEAIATLYGSAFQAPFGTFQQFTFDVISDILAFDSAAWLVGVHEINQLNSACYYQRPAIDVPRYLERYGASDGVRNFSANDPGTPYRIEDTVDLETYRTLPLYLEAGVAGGIEYAMGVTLREPVTDLFDFIVLYRADRACPFSDDERASFRTLAPHMATAWRHRQIVGLFEQSKGAVLGELASTRIHSVVDDLGAIYVADSDFAAALNDSFDGWTGSSLPDPLKAFIASGEMKTTLAGLDFVINRSANRHILSIHGGSANGTLSEGEKRTARLFAEGHTHHQIAQLLGISHHTVRNQLANVYRKLDIHSKLELVRVLA